MILHGTILGQKRPEIDGASIFTAVVHTRFTTQLSFIYQKYSYFLGLKVNLFTEEINLIRRGKYENYIIMEVDM